MQSRTPGSLVIIIAVAACLVVGLVACGGSAGVTAPALQGQTLEGGTFDLSQSGGRATVVNFFASWCPSCVDEAADVVAFAKAHPEIQMVGVAVNDAEDDTRRFVDEYGVPFPVVMDPNGQAAAAWGVDGIPATFFLDGDGRQQGLVVGPMTREQFEEKLQSIR
jgi:peroxiredoxin